MNQTMHRQNKTLFLISTGVLAMAFLLAAGCGDDGGDDQPDAAPQLTAREVYDAEVTPLLQARCAACHAQNVSYGWMYAADGDVYGTIMGWPGLVDLAAPANSTLLTKGAHGGGPAWTGDEASRVLAWIELEAQSRP